MGFAGAIYSLDYNPVWSYNSLMGWGFIALALVFFSMWNPFILLAGWSTSAHGNQVVQDPLGCSETCSARTAVYKRMNSRFLTMKRL